MFISDLEFQRFESKELEEIKASLAIIVRKYNIGNFEIAKGTGLAYNTVANFWSCSPTQQYRTISRIRHFIESYADRR